MLINFVNDELTKEINSDRPCSDYNNVTNLISCDVIKRRKGFLVEHFVKPPVSINLKFICSILIKEISVNCRVGVQKSSSVEVFTKQCGRRDNILVAKKFLKLNEDAVNFVLHGSQKMNNSVTFRLSKYMCNVDEVTIKILKTEGSTLPAIGSVDIWGKPSRHLDNTLIKEVTDIWTRINERPSTKITNTPQCSVKNTVFRYCREVHVPDVDIPEEFIDPITCDIFIIPMTLPSGKVVDASTIERFNKVEESFGRPPCDPFTGRIFTESSHPVVASALKGRLDKFLLDHSHIQKLKTIPRTVGRKAAFHSPQIHQINNYVSSDNKSLPSTSKSVKTVDQLLDSCLNGLPSFLEKPSLPDIETECVNCRVKLNLFKLNCTDLICRKCLVSFKNENVKFCKKCKQSLDFKKAERFHVV